MAERKRRKRVRRAKMNMGSTVRTVIAAAVVAAASLAFTGGTASAALKHETVLTEFKLGAPCTESISEFVPNTYDIAIDEHNEMDLRLLPTCRVELVRPSGRHQALQIQRRTGTVRRHREPYIDENMITFDPNSVYEDFTQGPELAVDNSETSNQGLLLQIFTRHLEILRTEWRIPRLHKTDCRIDNPDQPARRGRRGRQR